MERGLFRGSGDGCCHSPHHDKRRRADGCSRGVPPDPRTSGPTAGNQQEGEEAAVAVTRGGVFSEISAARGIGSPDKLAIRL